MFTGALLRRDDGDRAGGVCGTVPAHQVVAQRLENSSAKLSEPIAGVVSRRGMRDANRRRSACKSIYHEAIAVIA